MAFLSILGYHVGEPNFDLGQNVHLAMCGHETEPAVEIIWPHETEGPIRGLAERHPSGMTYHVCCTTDNLGFALARLGRSENTGHLRISSQASGSFRGRRTSFYNVAGIGPIEILE